MKYMLRKLYESSIIRYLFFGGCTTLINMVSFYVLRNIQIELNIANFISIILAILFAYVVNAKFVFKNKFETIIDYIHSFVKFISARAVTMVIEIVGVWLLVEVVSMSDMIGKLIIQFAVIILNYLFSRFLVFKKE